MNPTTLLRVAICSLVLLVADAHATTYAERLHELQTIQQSSFDQPMDEERRRNLIVENYQRLFPPLTASEIDKLSPTDLQSSFDAASLATFFRRSPDQIRNMELYLRTLEKSKLATRSDFVDMHGMYIATRAFDKANNLRAGHPDISLESAPRINGISETEPNKPSALRLSNDGKSLAYQRVDIRRKLIVIVAHPLCHFSASLVRDIQGTNLGKALSHALWLVPAGTNLNISDIKRWNMAYPDDQLVLTYRRENWPMFDAWATPTFYFLANGKIVAKAQGWPPQGGLNSLKEALKKWNDSGLK